MSPKVLLKQLQWGDYLNKSFGTSSDPQEAQRVQNHQHFMDLFVHTHGLSYYTFIFAFFKNCPDIISKISDPLEVLVKCEIYEVTLIDDGINAGKSQINGTSKCSTRIKSEKALCMYIRRPMVDIQQSFRKILSGLREVTPGNSLSQHYLTSHELTSTQLVKYGFCFTIFKPWHMNRLGVSAIILRLLANKDLGMNELRLSAAFWRKGNYELGLLQPAEFEPKRGLLSLKQMYEPLIRARMGSSLEVGGESNEENNGVPISLVNNSDNDSEISCCDTADAEIGAGRRADNGCNDGRYGTIEPSASNLRGNVVEAGNHSNISGLADYSNYGWKGPLRFIPGDIRLLASNEFTSENDVDNPPSYEDTVQRDVISR